MQTRTFFFFLDKEMILTKVFGDDIHARSLCLRVSLVGQRIKLFMLMISNVCISWKTSLEKNIERTHKFTVIYALYRVRNRYLFCFVFVGKFLESIREFVTISSCQYNNRIYPMFIVTKKVFFLEH